MPSSNTREVEDDAPVVREDNEDPTALPPPYPAEGMGLRGGRRGRRGRGNQGRGTGPVQVLEARDAHAAAALQRWKEAAIPDTIHTTPGPVTTADRVRTQQGNRLCPLQHHRQPRPRSTSAVHPSPHERRQPLCRWSYVRRW